MLRTVLRRRGNTSLTLLSEMLQYFEHRTVPAGAPRSATTPICVHRRCCQPNQPMTPFAARTPQKGSPSSASVIAAPSAGFKLGTPLKNGELIWNAALVQCVVTPQTNCWSRTVQPEGPKSSKNKRVAKMKPPSVAAKFLRFPLRAPYVSVRNSTSRPDPTNLIGTSRPKGEPAV